MPRRLAELPLILEALKRTTLVDASFVGYPNGEFMLFRLLRTSHQRTMFEAPNDAVLMVQSVTRDPAGVMHGLHQFFNAEGRLLDSIAKPGYRFDPRTRPWYKAWLEPRHHHDARPYPFFTTQEIGATMARRTARRQSRGRPRRHHGNDRGRAEGPQDHAVDGLAVIDFGQQVIGYHDAGRMIAPGGRRRSSPRADR